MKSSLNWPPCTSRWFLEPKYTKILVCEKVVFITHIKAPDYLKLIGFTCETNLWCDNEEQGIIFYYQVQQKTCLPLFVSF